MAINIFPRLDATGTNRSAPLRPGHWSTRGLLICSPFPQAVGGTTRPGTFLGANTNAYTSTPRGMTFTTTDSYLTLIPTAQAALVPTERVTVLCVRQCTDTTLRQSGLFSVGSANTLHRLCTHCPWVDGTVYWDFGGASGANRISVAVAKTTQIEAWAFVAGRNGSAFYKNGVKLASQSTAITRQTGAVPFDLNRGNGVSTSSDLQTVHFFALLDAEWTPTQVSEWSANPWLMFGSRTLAASAPAAAAVARTFAVFIG